MYLFSSNGEYIFKIFLLNLTNNFDLNNGKIEKDITLNYSFFL